MFQRFNDTTDIAVLILSYCKILKNVQTQKGLLSTLAMRKVTLDFINSNLKKTGALSLQLKFWKKVWVEWKVNFPVFSGQKSKREGECRSKSSGENQEMMLSGEWRYNLSLIGWTWPAPDTPPTYLLKKCFFRFNQLTPKGTETQLNLLSHQKHVS